MILKKIFLYDVNSLKEQFIRYGLVAIAAFVVDFGLLFLLTKYLHIFYLLSATFSFLISSAVNYLLSVKWVFFQRSNLSTTMEMMIFVVITLIGLCLNDVLLWFITEKLGIFYLFSKIIAGIIVFFWSFFSRRRLFTNHFK
jgi:putative flippase GtrA